LSFIVYQRSSSSNLPAPTSLSLTLHQHGRIPSALGLFDCTWSSVWRPAISLEPQGYKQYDKLKQKDDICSTRCKTRVTQEKTSAYITDVVYQISIALRSPVRVEVVQGLLLCERPWQPRFQISRSSNRLVTRTVSIYYGSYNSTRGFRQNRNAGTLCLNTV
jgi:hypothetical protein